MANIYSEPERSSGSAFAREHVNEERRADDASIATLLGGLVADAQSLVRKEIELAKQEVRVEVGKAKDSAISLGIGAGVTAVGGLLLILMLVHMLADVFDIRLWISYLIVGALLAVVGLFLLQRGRSKLNEISIVPHETVESVKKDVEAVQAALPSKDDVT